MTQAPNTVHRLFTQPIVNKDGTISRPWLRWFDDIETKTRQSLDLAGIITPNAIDFSRAYTKKNLDNIPDGVTYERIATVQPRQIKLSANVLDLTMLNANGTIVGANPLTATTGGSANHATISIASNIMQFGFGQVNYNSGSITPLLDGTTYYVFANDPNYQGGSVVYQATTSTSVTFSMLGQIFFGKITTPAFGGGGTGGSGGGGGGGRMFF